MLAVGTSDGCIHILHLNEKEVEEERKKQDPEEEWAYYGILKVALHTQFENVNVLLTFLPGR